MTCNPRSNTYVEGVIILVAHNNLHLTKRAVRSALQELACAVFVYDNASTDGTKEWLISQSGIGSIILPKQQSLSAVWNMALKHAFRYSDHALVLNNDVEIRGDTYEWLSSQPFKLVSAISVRTKEEMNKEPSSLSLSPDFSCFLIRKELYEKVGPFDESFFPAYVEDCDYHVRLHRAGFKAVCLDLPFLHHGAQTIKHVSPKEARRIERGADRNREMFRQRYGCLPGTEQYAKLFHVEQ